MAPQPVGEMSVGLSSSEIRFRARRGAVRLSIVRHRFAPPVVNYPSHVPLSTILQHPSVKELEADMQRKYALPVSNPIGEGYETRSCRFAFRVGHVLRLTARMEEHSVVIFHPVDVPYDSYGVQRFAFDVLKQVLRIEGEQLLPRMVAERATKQGLSYSAVKVRDAVSVWGTCSSRGTLNFSIYSLLLPDEYLDYLVWHELAHLTHMNHSADFWMLLSRYLGCDAMLLDKQVNALALAAPDLF